MKKIAINGFGRIGRLLARAWIENKEYGNVNLSVINAAGSGGIMTPKDVRYALKYDSNYGMLGNEPYYGKTENDRFIKCGENSIFIFCKEIKIWGENEPEKLSWEGAGIDIVVDCTGEFVKKSEAEKHLRSGAKKVIISAPLKKAEEAETVPHIVMGVNEKIYKPSSHHIVSASSCTTNALAAMLLPLQEKFGIKMGLMTTIHAFTGDQRLVDAKHTTDQRRARRALDNIILTSTNAAKTIHLIIPELKNSAEGAKIMDGLSIRVPVPTCSLIDLSVALEKSPAPEEIMETYYEYARKRLAGFLTVVEDPIASLDFLKSPFAVGIEKKIETVGAKERLYKILGWYDNEWGYVVQLLRLIKYVAGKLD